MCGISGAYAQKIMESHVSVVADVVKSQHQRGPDHTACEQIHGGSAEAVFGHNRLSILDLSSRANQPMWDASGRYCITYNGEIYNYIELQNELRDAGYVSTSDGDTGVILEAFARWGAAAPDHFNGPFAFAIFDRITGALQLFRDRFGVRPLYYINTGTVLYFASSAAVFARTFQLKPDLGWLGAGLRSFVYDNGGSKSPWEGICTLEAGHSLQVNVTTTGALSVSKAKYYDPTERVFNLIESMPVHDPSLLIEQVDYTLRKAVSLRLRSDVPLGVTLSSGLDSSTVAALAKQSGTTITGFSFGSPQNICSEGVLAGQCADFLDIRMEYIDPSPSDMADAFFETIDTQEAPFSGISMVAQYLLYKHIKKCGIKVILGGQGGDEAFMGYRKYILFRLRELLKQKRYMSVGSEWLKFIPTIIAEFASVKTYWQHRHRYMKKSPPHAVLNLPKTASPNLGLMVGSTLWDRQLQDIMHLSLPTLLRYEDRNAMGNSVESRLPFMDYHVIELGLALPAAFKLRAGYTKWPIRQIMQGKIPDSIRLARYKRGFDISLAPIVAAGLGKRIREGLQASRQALENFLMPRTEIYTAFSDKALLQRPGCLAEAIALLWIRRFCS